MKEIPLTKGKVAIVDDADFERLSCFQWHYFPHWKGKRGYAVRSVNFVKSNGERSCITIRMHREVLNAPGNLQVDHIDGDGLNNQRANLRVCTNSQNQANKPKIMIGRGHVTKSSSYKGVGYRVYKGSRVQSYRWVAQSKDRQGRQKTIGSFKSEIEAARAYDEWVKRVYGEFARVNFPTNDAQKIEQRFRSHGAPELDQAA